MPLPLFYKNVVQLNSETHRDLKIKIPSKPLSFASEANLIPALVEEFDLAVSDMPIAFLTGDNQSTAVFVTGLKPGTNNLVSKDGLWDGSYVPAYIRRYPFIVGNIEGAEPVLCIDDEFEGFQTKEGTRFFSDDGAQEEALSRAIILAEGYRVASVKTDEFVAKLGALNLLEDVSLDIKKPDGEIEKIHGLQIVSQDALSKLDKDQVFEMHQNGYLRAIHAHILSLQSLSKLNVAEKELPENAGKSEKTKSSKSK